MEVTVKTLDSQTKTLQVPIETTVKEFKEKIAEEMGIPTEKQRLIFQGKVLQDDKPLQEYRVDGCVVHLVEKQPPRSSRSNGQSTETSTSPTSTTSSGNVVMGAFALPVDVMGVTQQIVQGIIQQIGAESAQANISTSSSDDGSSVNVHINLSTVMSRNDARSRIAPARVHLNNVSSIVSRLQNDGMLPNNNMEEDTSSSESSNPQNGSENNSESTPEDLASILEEVVRLNDEIRPHLLRYQELLRATGTSRQLRPGDDLLPDLTAEALHSLSHAYHALSDLTTNFRMPEPRLNLLPSLSPIPAPAAHAHARTFPATRQSQETTSTGSGAGTAVSGSAVISGSGGISGSGVLSGGSPLNVGGNSTGSASIPATGAGNGEGRPRPHNHHPFLGFPMSLRNLPNLAVQFNPAAGNITIAHIVTTAVDSDSLRATTTTTNSTPTPRTSSRGSTPVPSQPNPAEGPTPPSREPVDGSTSTSSGPTSTSTGVTSSGVTSSEGGGRSAPRSSYDGNNAVLNFHPQHPGNRDPLLPCQSFHFGSPVQQPNVGSSVGHPAVPVATLHTPVNETQRQQRQEQQQQPGQQRQEQFSSSGTTPIPVFHTATVPSPAVLQQLLNIGQRAAAEAASAGGSDNPFIEFYVPPSSSVPQPFGSSDRSNDALRDFAALMAERQRTMTPEQRDARNAQSAASRETAGTLSRFLHRVSETFPMQQLMLSAFGGTVEPYTLTRTMSGEFLRDDVLGGAEPTSENLQRATEQILEELQKTFETTFEECNVKEAIDAPATLLTYLRPKIRRLLELVNSTEDDETYALEMNLLLSRASVELIALTEYCLVDGMHGMEVALRSSMSRSSAITVLDPGLRDMTIDTTWACIRDLRDSVRLNDAFLLPFVVRKEKRKNGAKMPKTPSPKMQKKEINKEETKEKTPAMAGASNAWNTSESSRPSDSSSKPKDVPMETDGEWKKVIPAEWVPVISQDIIRQRRLPRQAPFSDAYINGMPPKRRKIMEEPAPYSQCVSATLKRSITKAGVTPRTDLEKVNKEASSSLMLEKVFEQEVKKEVRERLSNDTDYNSEKFPSIHNYFEKDNSR